MRLLLDEMLPAVIAEQLRARRHDVTAVTERPELRSLADEEVFAIAQRERRAVVTENLGDFLGLADVADRRGASHFGVVLVDPGKFPRGRRRTIGRLVTALDTLVAQHPEDQAHSLRHWL